MTAPFPQATSDAIHMYQHCSPPPQSDSLIQFKHKLGLGKMVGWLMNTPGVYFCKLPCRVLDVVQDILFRALDEETTHQCIDLDHHHCMYQEKVCNNCSP